MAVKLTIEETAGQFGTNPFTRKAQIRDVSGEGVAEALDAALKLMNSKGGEHWVRRSVHKYRSFLRRGKPVQESCFCSAGAIMWATRDDPSLRLAAMRALAEHVRPGSVLSGDGPPRWQLRWRNNLISYAYGAIYRWNDSESTEWKDVQAAFRAAARKARKEAAS